MTKQTTVESVVFVIDDDAAVRASLKSLFKSVGLYVELFLELNKGEARTQVAG